MKVLAILSLVTVCCFCLDTDIGSRVDKLEHCAHGLDHNMSHFARMIEVNFNEINKKLNELDVINKKLDLIQETMTKNMMFATGIKNMLGNLGSFLIGLLGHKFFVNIFSTIKQWLVA